MTTLRFLAFSAILLLAAVLFTCLSRNGAVTESQISEDGSLPVERSSFCREALLSEAWGDQWSSVLQQQRLNDGMQEEWLQALPDNQAMLSWSEAFPQLRALVLEVIDSENQISFLTNVRRSTLDTLGPWHEDPLYNPAGVNLTSAQQQHLEKEAQDFLTDLAPLAEEAQLFFREAVESLLLTDQFDRGIDESAPQGPSYVEEQLHLRGACRRRLRSVGGGWRITVVVDSAYFRGLDEAMSRLRLACAARDDALRHAVADLVSSVPESND